MSVSNEINASINKNKIKFENDQSFKELKDYLGEMKESGFVKNNKYTLPPLDTTGKRLHEVKSNVKGAFL